MKKYLLFIVITALLTACDDLLNVTPGSDMTDEGFWKSETDLKGACNRMYQQFTSGNHDTRADDQVSGSPNKISTGQRTLQDASEADWKDPYDRIFLANNIIDKAAASPVAEAVRDRYIGEAMFFRAWYHFDLVQKYGDVPLVTKVFESGEDPDLSMPRTPREEVIQQCYQDLEFAAAKLPTFASWTTTDEFDRRRVTRSAALALEVRIALFEGTFQKYHNINGGANWKAHLQKAISAFELLRSEGHTLYTASSGALKPYQALFFDESQITNKEFIFGKAYGPNGGSGTGYTNHSYTGDSEGTYMVTRKMIDMYLYADGLPIEKSPLRIANEECFNNVFGVDHNSAALPDGKGQRDPRALMTFWTILDPLEKDATYGWIGAGKGDYLPFRTNSAATVAYNLKKRFKGSLWGASKDYTDIIIIRWAEMLIAYAEALYEVNGSISDAQLDETVNALRTRAGFSARLTNTFATSNGLNMLEEIRRERTIELMAENLRYYDLLRWKTAETELTKAVLGAKFAPEDNGTVQDLSRLVGADGKSNGESVMTSNTQQNVFVIEYPSTRKFDAARDYLYPVPPYEIAHSDGNVTQNPNWN
ncbi:MAG: RagB/SusD family nutrient uptake outer membrane protein [Dysgonamonadaceae bacterium]|jgi:hypothetical protein|nr:RagB/SusD family nutrient uptake outer membrane protein [Dysgonamonadaceae bacterium]